MLSLVNVRDADIADVAGKIMDVLAQRLQGAYMMVGEVGGSQGVLRKISGLVRKVQEVRRVVG